MIFDFKKIENYMREALVEANTALWKNEVPVGAVVVDENGIILSRACNNKEQQIDVTGHAEIVALRKAAQDISSWKLEKCSLFISLEPCPMCLSAILQSRIKNVYFGAYDKKGGALSCGYYLHKDKQMNHRFNVYGGFLNYECGKILSDFFKQKRKNYSS